MKIIWSPKARQKAREAVDFIKEDRPLASEEWLEGLVQRVLLLERVETLTLSLMRRELEGQSGQSST